MANVTTIERTTAADDRLPTLIRALDADLRARYGAVQAEYAPFNHMKDESPFVVALDETGTVIACGSFRPYDATSAEVKRMFVAEAARRRGVAQAVLAEVERWVRESGFSVAILETGHLQHEAIALYERCGYTRCDAFQPYVGMPASVCMRKPL
jgi:putative acetyltransferase